MIRRNRSSCAVGENNFSSGPGMILFSNIGFITVVTHVFVGAAFAFFVAQAHKGVTFMHIRV